MFDRIVEIIAKTTDIPQDKIHRNSRFAVDLAINSYEMTQMICDLEDALDVEIPEEAIREFRTVGDVVDYLEKTA